LSKATRRYLIPIALLGLATLAAGAIRRARPDSGGAGFGLEALPLQVGGYRGRALQTPENAYDYLEADEMIERVYVNPEETNTVKLTIVFARGWRALHSQRACLTNQGWAVIDDGAAEIPAGDGTGTLHATRLLLERSGSRIVVIYLFVTGKATTGSWFLHSARMALGGGRQGGALLVAVAPTESAATDAAAERAAAGIIVEATRFMQERWGVR
jgi:EpsI family protein